MKWIYKPAKSAADNAERRSEMVNPCPEGRNRQRIYRRDDTYSGNFALGTLIHNAN